MCYFNWTVWTYCNIIGNMAEMWFSHCVHSRWSPQSQAPPTPGRPQLWLHQRQLHRRKSHLPFCSESFPITVLYWETHQVITYPFLNNHRPFHSILCCPKQSGTPDLPLRGYSCSWKHQAPPLGILARCHVCLVTTSTTPYPMLLIDNKLIL
jgi:hypothetical protein